MNVIKKISTAILVLGVTSAFVACSDDDSSPTLDGQGKMTISAMATYNPTGGRGLDADQIDIASFLINFKEIELEFEEGSSNDPFYDGEDEIELKGPFEVELMSPTPIPIVDIVLPNAVFEEIEFEFDKSTDPNSDLFEKSMKMEGEINGVPFVFWHDFEEEIELEFENGEQNIIVQNNENEILINIDLNEVLNATQTVNLGSATDGNGDGIIEISPDDNDGNNALADKLKEAIKDQIELIEDRYDD